VWLDSAVGLPAARLTDVPPAPVPVSATVVGLLVALLVIVSAPVRVPDAVGRKLTLAVQDAPAAMDPPHVLLIV
jgi:hypothetical protein